MAQLGCNFMLDLDCGVLERLNVEAKGVIFSPSRKCASNWGTLLICNDLLLFLFLIFFYTSLIIIIIIISEAWREMGKNA